MIQLSGSYCIPIPIPQPSLAFNPSVLGGGGKLGSTLFLEV